MTTPTRVLSDEQIAELAKQFDMEPDSDITIVCGSQLVAFARSLLAKLAVPQKYDACDPGNWRDGDDAMGNHTAAPQPAQPQVALDDNSRGILSDALGMYARKHGMAPSQRQAIELMLDRLTT